MNNMIIHDAPALTLKDNVKDKERKFNKFLNKTDVMN